MVGSFILAHTLTLVLSIVVFEIVGRSHTYEGAFGRRLVILLRNARPNSVKQKPVTVLVSFDDRDWVFLSRFYWRHSE